MNKEQAKRLIKDTFETSFDKGKFIIFIKDLLNRIDESKARHFRGYVKHAFKQVAKVIKTYERVGTYTDSSGKKIDVLIVYLEKRVSLDRARTTMRNFVAKYLKDRGEKNAALVAYVSPDEEDWRFSLVKMDYRFEEAKTGRVKIKEEFTPARRWSFLVGKNEKSHTARSRFVPILKDDEHNPTLEQLEEAFNIERVSKEFFEKYRALFMGTVNALDKIVKKDGKVRENFELKNINTVDFAKKLLGQIVFLYFLQKKGWFGVKRDADWGTGPKNFLRQLFEKNLGDYNNFFNNILEPLFYEALARERDDNYYSRFNCKIPFLNGGLFEPIGTYDWVHTDINLPNELFSNSYKTEEGDIGNGILDVLDRFNFTVKEDEPLEKEVAIDPELLGKLYEKFNAIRPDNFYEYKEALASGKKTLEKKFNKQYGVYYTPREIVHYMCQQSLINYLHTSVNQELMKQPARTPRQIKLIGPQEPMQLRFHTEKEIVRKQALEKLIKYGEQFIENELAAVEKIKQIQEGKQKTTSIKTLLPKSVVDNVHSIDNALKNIKVCDPAVGSGAFLVGMMSEIVKTRNVLSPFLSLRGAEATKQSQTAEDHFSDTRYANRSIYNFKRDCIENSIYGVDIDPGAVEIAKLRLWLSLVVDEEDFKRIKPLPNLDYKIVCGNSLLGFPENWGSPIEKQIESLMDEYFSITNPEKKRELKNKIDEKIKSRYANSGKTFGYKINFDFKTVFSKVFREKGGFDVVIANPPYVRQEKIKDQKQALQKQGYDVYNSTSDLYTYFYERSYHILKPNGFSCFISSNKWMRAKYGEKLRRLFKEKTTLKQIIDFNGFQVFDATVDTDILLFQKTKSSGNIVNILNIQPDFTPSTDIANYFNSHKLKMKQSDFDSNCFAFGDEITLNLKKKIEEKGIPLKNWDVNIYRGIVTGFNEAFIIDMQTKKRLFREDPKSAEIIKPILRGRDIHRYGYKWAGLWVIATFPTLRLNIDDYPAVKNYLLSFGKKRLEQSGKKGARKKTNNKWFETQDTIAYYPEFEKEKIVWAETAQEIKMAFVPKGFYLQKTCFMITGKNLKYIQAISNSSLLDFYIQTSVYKLGEKGVYLSGYFMEQLAIPKISKDNQKLIISAVDKIRTITQDSDYLENPAKQEKVKEYERQIEQMVYKLYGLTEEEIKIVEK